MNKNQLEICLDPPIKFFLHHALPLAIISIESNINNFLFSNYIQIYKNPKNKYLFDLYPRIGSAKTYGHYPLDHILENHILSADTIEINEKNIIEYIVKWIDNGYYVQITSDERVINGTSGYGKSCFHDHPAFYYGYDLQCKKVKMLNYDLDGNFSEIYVDFHNIIKSFQSDDLRVYFKKANINGFMIQLRKTNKAILKQNYTDEKTIIHIKDGIEDYLNCRNSTRNQILQFDEVKDCIWGLDAYEYLRKYLVGEYDSPFAFQCSCGLLEHKQIMKERILFLCRKGYVFPKEIIEQADSLVKESTKFRTRVFRCLISNNLVKLRESLSCIDNIKDIETKMLEQIINII